MKTWFVRILVAFCLVGLWLPQLQSEPLPRIQLRPIFPALSLQRTLWMSEAPDHSGRMFIVQQEGRILIVRKGTEGNESKEFLYIVDRKPFVDNEEGLLS